MAFQITPGYDFTVNEIPTREKLQIMMAGISLTGVDLSLVDVTLLGNQIVAGACDVSLPSPGWMAVDFTGALWVQTSHGRVRLYRASWGGLETNRYPVGAAIDTYTHPTARDVVISKLGPAVANSSNESAVIWRAGTDQVFPQVGKCMDTGVSGAFVIHLLRGAFIKPVQAAARRTFPDYLLRHTSGNGNSNIERFPFQIGTATQQVHGIATRESSAGEDALSWYYGVEMQVF